MAEQYDPRQLSRSPFERRPEPRAATVRQEDPLAELAKIVQGRPGSATSPAAKMTARPLNESNGTSDLEAELLNDLQASFAAVREAATPSPVVRDVQQPQSPLPPNAYSTEPEPIAAAGMSDSWTAPPAQSALRDDARMELRPEFRPEPLDESRLVAIPSAPVLQPSITPAMAERRAVAEAAPALPPPDRVLRPARAPLPPAAENVPATGGFQLRPTTVAVAAQPAPVRQPHSRWEKPEPAPQQIAAPSRFAPPQAVSPAEDAFDDEELDPFAEGGLFQESQETAENDDPFPPLDGFGMVPGYGEDENQAPYGDEDVAPVEGLRRPRRSLIVVGAVVAVALLGGVAVAMFRSGGASSGPPPTIVADGAPTKITPDDTPSAAASDADAQNKLVYDRVNADEANTNTTLLTPDSGPIKDAGSGGSGDNAISRVILPGGPGFDTPATDNAPTAAPVTSSAAPSDGDTSVAVGDAPDSGEQIGPRKVRTVVVKPDGTILSNETASANAPGPSTVPQPAAPSPAPATPPVTDDTAAIAGSNALAITPNSDGSAPPAGTARAPVEVVTPAAATSPAPAPAPVAVTPIAPGPTKPVKPKPAPAPTVVATADKNGPIDLTPGVSPAETPAAADGVLVQISSQRSEDAARATYRDLQTRYPNILGKYDVNLQRADVPVRGTFYRVRVGPFSAADAQRLCDDLKSAGGDCVLAKR